MHDWSLVSLHVDWSTGSATIEVKGPGATSRVIEIKALLGMNITRKHPWGESVSINEVAQSQDAMSGIYSLFIEMQSGDILQVEAGFISNL